VGYELYRDSIDEIRHVWDQHATFSVDVAQAPRVRATIALAANAFGHSRAATTLWDQEIFAESGPSLRACFESAVYAAWVQQSDLSAGKALTHVTGEHGVKLLDQMKAAAVDVPAGLESATKILLNDPPVGQVAEKVRNFKAMCYNFNGGEKLYLMYKSYSGESHALDALRRYLVVDNGELFPIKVAVDSTNKEAAAAFGASCLLWAASASDEVDSTHPNRGELTRIGAQIGCSPLLQFK
jgi:hypothetical protein